MAPFVEMLPTNFFPDEPPSPEPESEAEPELEDPPDPDPELDPDPEVEELPLDEEPDPELVLPLEPDVEPEEAPGDPELEADPVDEPPSAFEPDPVPVPPPSSFDEAVWSEPAEEPHAIAMTHAKTAGRGSRRRDVCFISSAVAAPRETRQGIGTRHGDGFLRQPPLLTVTPWTALALRQFSPKRQRPRAAGSRMATAAIAACLALGPCSSSGSPKVFGDPPGSSTSSGDSGGSSSGSSGGSSGAGNSGSPNGDDGGSSLGDDGGSGTTSSSSGGGVMLDASGWTCPFDTVFGGYTMACVSCVEAMCTSQVTACVSGTCASCEGPVFTCLSASCESACAPGTGSNGGGASGGSSSAGACASLSTYCPLLAVVSAQHASQCTMTASGGNDGSCQNFVVAVNSVAPGVCP
jgi:hypothetical protein